MKINICIMIYEHTSSMSNPKKLTAGEVVISPALIWRVGNATSVAPSNDNCSSLACLRGFLSYICDIICLIFISKGKCNCSPY